MECVHDIFFHPVTGIGRNFEQPATKSVKRFKESLVSAMAEYSRRFLQQQEQSRVPTPIMIIGHDLHTSRENAITERNRVRAARKEAEG